MKTRKIEAGLFFLFFTLLIVSIIVRIKAGAEYEFFNIIKPATVIQYSGFISFALLVDLNRKFLDKIRTDHLRLLMILGFFCIMGSLFEVFWAFGYWFANYELDVIEGMPSNSRTLDAINYTPSNELRSVYLYDQYSLNLSAKKNMLYFMMAAYFTYVIHSILQERRLR